MMKMFEITGGILINLDKLVSLEPIDPTRLPEDSTGKTLVVMGTVGSGGYLDDREVTELVAAMNDEQNWQ